jgi:hypothetical protein
VTDKTSAGRDYERVLGELEVIAASFETLALSAVVHPVLTTELTIQQTKVLTVLITSAEGPVAGVG